jgi:methyltransferase-like protein
MIPKIGPQVAWQIVDGEAIVVDLASGNTIGLNPVATFLWSHIDGTQDDTALVTAVVTEFEVSPALAERDTREFLDEMKRRTLIVDTEIGVREAL